MLKYLAGSDDIDKAVDVDVDKGGHEELTVESVHDASMARDDVTKVLDLERSLKSGCKETAERPDDGGEERHEEAVDEEGIEGDSFLHVQQSPPRGDGLGQGVLLGPEQGARLTAHGHPLQVGGVLDGTNKVGKLNK